MEINDVFCDNGLLSKYIDNYKSRDGQIKISSFIDTTYKERGICLINAPTGNGKSLACLVPAILNKQKGKTIVSTATKALQTQYESKDLPLLHNILDFKSFVLKGKNNYVCIDSLNDLDIPDEIKKDILKWLSDTVNGDFDEVNFYLPNMIKAKINCSNDTCLEKECDYYDKCFYYNNKIKSEQSDVLVINHDLLSLYLILKNRYNVNLFGDVYSIIIDEAHKFEDIYTRHCGLSIGIHTFNIFCDNIEKYINICYDRKFCNDNEHKNISIKLNNISIKSNKLFSTYVTGNNETFRIKSVNDFDGNLFKSLLHDIENILYVLPDVERFDKNNDKKVIKLNERIKTSYNSISKIINLYIELDIDKYCYYFECANMIKQIKINVYPIDISEELNKSLFNISERISFGNDIGCVCLMSATLSNKNDFTFVKNRLGIPDNFYLSDKKCLKEMCVNDIFDYKHSCLLYMPENLIDPPNNGTNKKIFSERISSTICELSNIIDGGIISLFTSYGEMDKVYNSLVNKNLNRKIINQSDNSVSMNLSMIKDIGDCIFVGTKTYWEGVDIQGKACSCVLIDKIPFPVPTEPIIESRIEHIKKNNGDWFNAYYFPMAIIALQQGFGRLIRTKDDLGIVVLFDNRILTKPYGRKILKSLPDCIKTRKIDKVKTFWDIVLKKRKIRGYG